MVVCWPVWARYGTVNLLCAALLAVLYVYTAWITAKRKSERVCSFFCAFSSRLRLNCIGFLLPWTSFSHKQLLCKFIFHTWSHKTFPPCSCGRRQRRRRRGKGLAGARGSGDMHERGKKMYTQNSLFMPHSWRGSQNKNYDTICKGYLFIYFMSIS